MSTFALANPPIATSSPSLVATPAFTAFTPVLLAPAASLVEGSPSATFTFTVTGRNFLTAAALTAGLPVLGTPTLVGHSALSAASLAASSPVLAAAALVQAGGLSSGALAPGSPVFGAATLKGVQNLTALALVPSSPLLGTPTLGLTGHITLAAASSLTPSGPALGAPGMLSFATPTQRTTAVVTASGLVTVTQTGFHLAEVPGGTLNETVGNPPLFAIGAHAGSPVLGAVSLHVVVNLAASGFATGAAGLGVGTPILSASSLTAGSPVLGAGVAGRGLGVAVGLSPTSPVIGSPTLDATGVTLLAIPLTVGVGGAGFMTLMFIASGTALGEGIGVPAPAIGQLLSAAPLTPTAPVVGHSAIVPIFNFHAALAFATASPVFSAPNLNVFAHPRTAAAIIASGIAIVTQTKYRQTNLPGSMLDDNLWPPPQVAFPLLGASPILGDPLFESIDLLSAVSLAAGSPVIAQPFMGVTGKTLAPPLIDSPPVLGSPTLTLIYNFSTASLSPASPVFTAPTLVPGVIYALAAVDLSVIQLGISQPTLRQRQTLTAASIITTVPEIDRPILILAASLTTTPIVLSSPVLGDPILGQIDNLAAIGLIDSVQFGPVIMGGHHFLVPPPGPLVTGPPQFGDANFKQTYPPGTKFITLVTPPRVIVVTYVYPWTIEAVA